MKFLLICSLALNSVLLQSQKSTGQDQYVVTINNSILQTWDGQKYSRMDDVGPATVLQISEEQVGKDHFVVLSDKSPAGSRVVVERKDTIYLHGPVSSLLRRDTADSDKSSREIPILIQIADPKILEAWKRLAPAIEWNESQPIDKQIPEPYFVLGQLWTAVGGNNEALQAYLKAAASIPSNPKGEEFTRYQNLASLIREALMREVKLPGEPTLSSARKYWGSGVTYFRRGEYQSAISSFSDASHLDPKTPSYWYCLALTYKSLGDDSRAEKYVRIGAISESRHPGYRGNFDKDLEKFQGADRTWLENARHGAAQFWRRMQNDVTRSPQ